MDNNLGELASALCKAQKEFKDIPRNRSVSVKMKSGGTYTYSYATLPTVMDAVRESLAQNELSYSQTVDHDDGGTYLTTLLLHSSSGFLESRYPLPNPSTLAPQDFASHLTYARRYAITCILGVSADDDDDANGANNNQLASPGDFVMPFGTHKGTPIKDIPATELSKTIKWCKEKDAAKFKSLIDSIDRYLKRGKE